MIKSQNQHGIQALGFVITVLLLFTLASLSYYPDYSTKEDASFTFDQELSPEQQKVQETIDKKYCNGPCRFINFISIREQETRAQLHLRHLSFTAGLLNRTVVLPNVSGSRLGACLPYDFEYYYDIDWAKRNKDHFNYITMNDFTNWLKERKSNGVPASDQVLSVFGENEAGALAPSKIMHCFSGYTKPVSPYNQIMSWRTRGEYREERRVAIMKFLQGITDEAPNEKKNQDLEVIQFRLHQANPFLDLDEANIPIPYSKEINNFADITAKSLGAFTAVHWRMENARYVENLLDCAHHLVEMLEEKNLNQSKVFMLTDYPHAFTADQLEEALEKHATHEQLLQWLTSTSDTFLFENITSSHHKAIQYLFEHHPFNLFETTMESRLNDPPTNWNLLPIPDHLKRINVLTEGGVAMIDSGWLGILDKLMAIRAYQFLAGNGDRCGRGHSTFTALIVEERKQAGKLPVHKFGHTYHPPKNTSSTIE